MKEVYERIFVADENSCMNGSTELVVVHACKFPCHRRVLGYKNALPKNHSNYLVYEQDYDLYLNIIDPSTPLFFLPPLFSSFLEFANKHWNNGKKVLIHCNRGESRAPSLALLFLAKGLSKIDKSSYNAARKEFEVLYPHYNPGIGIQIYFDVTKTSITTVCHLYKHI